MSESRSLIHAPKSFTHSHMDTHCQNYWKMNRLRRNKIQCWEIVWYRDVFCVYLSFNMVKKCIWKRVVCGIATYQAYPFLSKPTAQSHNNQCLNVYVFWVSLFLPPPLFLETNTKTAHTSYEEIMMTVNVVVLMFCVFLRTGSRKLWWQSNCPDVY